jgi:Flp pilus assembly pilin Flp
MPEISLTGTLRGRSGVRPARIGGKRMQRYEDYRDETGQTMSEYAIVLAVISPAIVASLALLSQGFQDRLATVIGYLT